MAIAGNRVAWPTIRGFFGKDFQDYVDRVIAEVPVAIDSAGLLAQWQAAAKALPR